MRLAWIAATAVCLGFYGGQAIPAHAAALKSAGALAPDAVSARAQVQARVFKRPRPRVTITPRRPAATLYPSPYPYAYPGPGALRECTSWLEQEPRPSGTVIVPRMRCWWVRR